ncbi:MAG: helix-turn-helix transcriptional regulator [Chlorobi bacterium]|nr:helix-turn-helix transcriptional regulator [Chlorobiota bacterium]
MNFISNNIKYLRKQKNLLQSELADKINVKRTSVASWEQGVSYPNLDTLVRICGFFSVTLDEIVTQNLAERNDLDNKYNIVNERMANYGTNEDLLCHEVDMLKKQLDNCEKQIVEHKNIIEHYKFIISKIEMQDNAGQGKSNIKEQEDHKDTN